MPGSYEVCINGLLEDVPVSNVLHFGTTGESTNNYLTAIALKDELIAGSTEILTDMLSALPVTYLLDSVTVRGIITENGGGGTTPTVLESMPLNPGSRTGDVQSNQATPLICFTTDTSGVPDITRQRIGKIFLAGISETDANDDVIQAGLLTPIGNFISALGVAHPLGGGVEALFRIRISKVILGPPKITERYLVPVVEAIAKLFVASQRDRRPGR